MDGLYKDTYQFEFDIRSLNVWLQERKGSNKQVNKINSKFRLNQSYKT